MPTTYRDLSGDVVAETHHRPDDYYGSPRDLLVHIKQSASAVVICESGMGDEPREVCLQDIIEQTPDVYRKGAAAEGDPWWRYTNPPETVGDWFERGALQRP